MASNNKSRKKKKKKKKERALHAFMWYPLCAIASYKEKMREKKKKKKNSSEHLRQCQGCVWKQLIFGHTKKNKKKKPPLHPRSCRHSTLVCSTLIPTRVMSRLAVKLPANVGRNPLCAEWKLPLRPSVRSPHLICGRATTEPLVSQSQKWPRLLLRRVQLCDTYANAPVLQKASSNLYDAKKKKKRR